MHIKLSHGAKQIKSEKKQWRREKNVIERERKRRERERERERESKKREI